MTIRHALPMILTEVTAVSVERLSPSCIRVELSAPELAEFGVEGKLFDQRIKLIFPNEAGELPSFHGVDESWFTTWLEIPAEQRGHMRTYSVRDLHGEGTDTLLVVDIVLHLGHGESGPGSQWAATASAGDRLVLIGPKRGEPFGGIEFAPKGAARILLAGDETAVPAICRILTDLDCDASGVAFLEVPESADVLETTAPRDVEVLWLPRNGAPLGERQIAAMRRQMGLAPHADMVDDRGVPTDLWETPSYSSSGEELIGSAKGSEERDLYAWIAGESKVVSTLRRCLVNEMGLERQQVAFMGYWRRGVAMRS